MVTHIQFQQQVQKLDRCLGGLCFLGLQVLFVYENCLLLQLENITSFLMVYSFAPVFFLSFLFTLTRLHHSHSDKLAARKRTWLLCHHRSAILFKMVKSKPCKADAYRFLLTEILNSLLTPYVRSIRLIRATLHALSEL